MFFVIMLIVVFGRNIFLIFVALGAVEWLTMARIVRGQTIAVKRKEFIEAAQAGGVSNTKIIFRHVIPNVLGPVIVYMTLTIRSEEHTSELQSLMRISYAVFCLTKKTRQVIEYTHTPTDES